MLEKALIQRSYRKTRVTKLPSDKKQKNKTIKED